jgi:hypothetical protein
MNSAESAVVHALKARDIDTLLGTRGLNEDVVIVSEVDTGLLLNGVVKDIKSSCLISALPIARPIITAKELIDSRIIDCNGGRREFIGVSIWMFF